MLPAQWSSFTLKHIRFRGQLYDITVKRDAQGNASLTRTPL
jgi:cellobiose phosphorylase